MANESLSPEQYITERVDRQIQWYDTRSAFNKRMFYIFSILNLALAASIPFLTGFISNSPTCIKVIVGFTGVLVTIVSGLLTFMKWQENWIQYRSTCETLRHEKLFFLTKTMLYQTSEPFKLFVQRIESLISKENSSWAQYVTKTQKEESHGH